MANVRNNVLTQETRRRLLAAAGELFAEKGYRETSINEITKLAGASVAAVNYHFRGKERLYRAVLQSLADETMACIPPDDVLTGDAANRLRHFLLHFCRFMKRRRHPPWVELLSARHHQRQPISIEPLYHQIFDPLMAKLNAILAELMDLPPTQREVAFAAACVFGQCLYFCRNHDLVRFAHPQLGGDGPSAEEIAQHVGDFTLASLRTH